MLNPTISNITECQQCGTCCKKGGPSLHYEDIEILRNSYIEYEQLVTIRKGELAYNPINEKLEPAPLELIKVSGAGRDWTCCFFDPQKSVCTIYDHRPLECRLLKCWDIEDLSAIIGKDTISRTDIINADDPILELIEQHEEECPCSKIEGLVAAWSEDKENQNHCNELTDLIRKDLALRDRAIFEMGLPQKVELFIFGRPLFKQIIPFGITVEEKDGDIQLSWK